MDANLSTVAGQAFTGVKLPFKFLHPGVFKKLVFSVSRMVTVMMRTTPTSATRTCRLVALPQTSFVETCVCVRNDLMLNPIKIDVQFPSSLRMVQGKFLYLDIITTLHLWYRVYSPELLSYTRVACFYLHFEIVLYQKGVLCVRLSASDTSKFSCILSSEFSMTFERQPISPIPNLPHRFLSYLGATVRTSLQKLHVRNGLSFRGYYS